MIETRSSGTPTSAGYRVAGTQGQGPLNLGKPDGAPLPEGRRRGQAFGEDPARAAGVRAAEAADLEGQGDDAAHQGKVGDMADVAAVDPSRRQGADRTAGGEIGATGVYGNELRIHCDAVNGKLARQQGQQGFGDHGQCELRRDWFPLYAHPMAHSHQAAPRMRMGRNLHAGRMLSFADGCPERGSAWISGGCGVQNGVG